MGAGEKSKSLCAALEKGRQQKNRKALYGTGFMALQMIIMKYINYFFHYLNPNRNEQPPWHFLSASRLNELVNILKTKLFVCLHMFNVVNWPRNTDIACSFAPIIKTFMNTNENP